VNIKLKKWTPPPPPPRWYLYFGVLKRLTWPNDLKSYAGGSVASDRACHAVQDKRDDPDQKGYSGPTGLGLGVVFKTAPLRVFNCREACNNCRAETSDNRRGQGWQWTVAPVEEEELRHTLQAFFIHLRSDEHIESNSVLTSLSGLNILCRYKRVLL
jgi:hypothetical protein